jgi:hypothetical protein
MPSTTPRQARFMAACAHGAGYESCPPQKVSSEFNQADKGTSMLSRAMRRKRMQIGGLSAPMMNRGPIPPPGSAQPNNLASMLAALRARGGVGGMAGGFGLGNMLGSGQIRPPVTGGGAPIGAMTPPAPMARPPMSGAPGGGLMGGIMGPGMMMGSGPVPQQPATTPQGLLPPRMPATQAQPGGVGMLGRLGPMMGRGAMMARGGRSPMMPPGMARPGLPGSLAPRTVSPLQSLISAPMAARHRGPGFGVSLAPPSPYAQERSLQRSRLGNFPVAGGGSVYTPRRSLPRR